MAFLAVISSFMLGVPLGALSAVKRGSGIDYVARMLTCTGISTPIFVTGLVVIYLLVRLFNRFPPLGYAFLWEDRLTDLQQMIFPVPALVFFELNFTARVTRTAMLEVLREDYTAAPRSKGLGEGTIVPVQALKNAFLPIARCPAGPWLAYLEERSSSKRSF